MSAQLTEQEEQIASPVHAELLNEHNIEDHDGEHPEPEDSAGVV